MAYYRGITNVVHLQLHKNNYFNIAKARRERTREAEEARVRVPGRTRRQGKRSEEEEEASNQESTSEREDAGDA
jgi:hypothetical protein